MPIISVKMVKGRTLAVKRKLAKEITDAAVKNLKVLPEWVNIVIEEYPRENWATGGELHCDKFGKGFGKKTACKK